jgi:hypothetical protein
MAITTPYRRYLIQATLAFFGTCLFAAFFNLLIDPYGLFGSPRIEGVNAVKPEAPERIRYVKPYYADRVAARTLIAGNSRPEMGLDPASHCWKPNEQPVFNTGVPGLGVSDQIGFVEHAATDGNVKNVFLGLDLTDFFVSSKTSLNDVAKSEPITESKFNLRTKMDGSPNPHYSKHRLKDWLTGLFSLETVSDSFVTIIQQHRENQPTRRADGFNPANDYHPIISAEGQAVLFVQKNQEIVQSFSKLGRDIYQESTDWSSLFETLDRFLTRAGERGINVVLFINPYHADYLATIALTDHWILLDQWKRTLLAIADRHNLSLWDFNAVDERTGEPPPKPGDRTTELRWFWEPAHYRSEYGEQMLSAMLERDCAAGFPEKQHIVYRLTQTNIEEHLIDLRRDLQIYITNHPEIIARIDAAMKISKE